MKHVALFALLLAACNAETPAQNAGAECSSDANCALSNWNAECCPRCKPFSAPYSEVAAMESRCTSMAPVSARCQEVKCPEHEGPDWIAKCVSGRCVVGP